MIPVLVLLTYLLILINISPWYLGSFVVLGPVRHAQLNPFYHPFYPNVTKREKDTRLSPTFRTASDESWAGPGYEASLTNVTRHMT